MKCMQMRCQSYRNIYQKTAKVTNLLQNSTFTFRFIKRLSIDIEYMWIRQGKNCRKFRLLTLTLLIDQLVHSYFSQIQVSLLIEYMIIWCEMQVMIKLLNFLYFFL